MRTNPTQSTDLQHLWHQQESRSGCALIILVAEYFIGIDFMIIDEITIHHVRISSPPAFQLRWHYSPRSQIRTGPRTNEAAWYAWLVPSWNSSRMQVRFFILPWPRLKCIGICSFGLHIQNAYTQLDCPQINVSHPLGYASTNSPRWHIASHDGMQWSSYSTHIGLVCDDKNSTFKLHLHSRLWRSVLCNRFRTSVRTSRQERFVCCEVYCCDALEC